MIPCSSKSLLPPPFSQEFPEHSDYADLPPKCSIMDGPSLLNRGVCVRIPIKIASRREHKPNHSPENPKPANLTWPCKKNRKNIVNRRESSCTTQHCDGRINHVTGCERDDKAHYEKREIPE